MSALGAFRQMIPQTQELPVTPNRIYQEMNSEKKDTDIDSLAKQIEKMTLMLQGNQPRNQGNYNRNNNYNRYNNGNNENYNQRRNLDHVECYNCGTRGHYANTCPEGNNNERNGNYQRNNNDRNRQPRNNNNPPRNNRSLNFCRATFEEEDALDFGYSSSDNEYSEDEKQVFVNTRSGKRTRPNEILDDDDSEDEQQPQNRRNFVNKNQDISNKRKMGLQKAREKSRQKNICNRCGMQGHFGTECPRLWCTRCSQKGHEYDKCPVYPMEKKFRKKNVISEDQIKKELDFVKYIVKNLSKVIHKGKLAEEIQKYKKKGGINYVEKNETDEYTPTICDVNIQGMETEAIVDSGSSVTVITKGLMDELPYEITEPSRTNLNSFGNGKYPSLGKINGMEFFVGNVKTKMDVEVVDFPEEMFLLGTDWMRRERAGIDYDREVLTIRKNGKDNLVPIYFREDKEENEEEYEEDLC